MLQGEADVAGSEFQAHPGTHFEVLARHRDPATGEIKAGQVVSLVMNCDQRLDNRCRIAFQCRRKIEPGEYIVNITRCPQV